MGDVINIATTAAVTIQVTAEKEYPLLPLLPAGWHVPSANEHFTGREALLKQIKDSLTTTKPVILAALNGLGGVGKTQLATRFIHAHAPGQAFWFSAVSSTQIAADYQELAEALKLPTTNLKPEQIREHVKDYFVSHPGWLIVYDDAPNYEVIEPFIPHAGGKVLVTSRYTEGWPSQPLPVDVFSPEDARNYVVTILKQDLQRAGQDTTEQIDKLTELMGYLPLALAQASAYIKKSRISIEKYRADYAKHKAKFLNDTTMPIKGAHVPVYVTWDMSLQVISQESPLTVRMLNLSAYLNVGGIPQFVLESLFKALDPSDEILLSDVQGILASYSLWNVNIGEQAISLHPLVKEVIQLKLSPQQKLTDLELLVSMLETVFQYQRYKVLWPHIEAILTIADELYTSLLDATTKATFEKMITLPLLKLGAENSLHQGASAKAKELLERALQLQETHYGKDHVQLAVILVNLGSAYGDLGDVTHKKALLERALQLKEAHYGKQHVQLAVTLVSLGNTYGDLGDVTSQKALLERALQLQEAHYNKQHIELAVTLVSLGNAYGTLGDMTRQKALLERALLLQEAHYGKNHVRLAVTLVNLGNAYGTLGDETSKKALLERALLLQEAHYGKQHVQLAGTLMNLGNAYGALGDVTHQKALLERALLLQEAHYGKQHVELAMTLGNLGIAYGELGDVTRKKALLERALLLQEALYGKNHVRLAAALRNLGNAYGELGDVTGKKALLERTLQLEEAHYGKDHVQLAGTFVDLGIAYGALGDLTHQKALFERALLLQETHYGKEHPVPARTRYNLAQTYKQTQDYQRAAELAKEAYVVCRSHPDSGEQHPSTLNIKSFIDNITKDIAKAEELQKKYFLENTSQATLEEGLRMAAVNNCSLDIECFIDELWVGVNAQDNKVKKTALHHAVIKGHTESMAALVTRYARWDIGDSNNKNAVDYAKEQSNTDIFLVLSKLGRPRILRKHQTVSEEALPSGEEVLRRAATVGSLLDLELLIASGVNIDAQDDNPSSRKTALHIAVAGKQVAIVACLLKNSAQTTIADANKVTVQDMLLEATCPDEIKELFAPAQSSSCSYR